MPTTMTPQHVFDFLNQNTTDAYAPIPNRICLEVGSLGNQNAIHFFKWPANGQDRQLGRFRRFCYAQPQAATWNLRRIIMMTPPIGAGVATYHIDVQGNTGSYAAENLNQGGNNNGYWPLNPVEVDAVIGQYQSLRSRDMQNGTQTHRQTGWYNQPNWPIAPGMISSPWVAALIVRFHDQNPDFWY